MNVPPAPVALVTGADGDLGLEVARMLALTGARVIAAARTAEAAKAAVVDLPGVDALGVDLDLTDDDSVIASVAAVLASHGHLDVLVNAVAEPVGARSAMGAATQVDLGEAWQLLDLAVFGAWRLTRAFLPLLLESEHPRVVNVTSSPRSHADPASGSGAYGDDAALGVATAGLNALTSLLAAELATGGILVNAVCPEGPSHGGVGDARSPSAASAPGVVWAATLPDDGPTGGFFRNGADVFG